MGLPYHAVFCFLDMSTTLFNRIFGLAALIALLGGCALGPATDSHPANTMYRCDRNGDVEQREAC